MGFDIIPTEIFKKEAKRLSKTHNNLKWAKPHFYWYAPSGLKSECH